MLPVFVYRSVRDQKWSINTNSTAPQNSTTTANTSLSSTTQTLIRVIERKNLWVFSLLNTTEAVCQRGDSICDRHISAEYPLAMHVKYELLYRTILTNPYRTKYFAWVDIGYYRKYLNKTEHFIIELPKGFEKDKIAYGDVSRLWGSANNREQLSKDEKRIAGGFFIGMLEPLLRWSVEYLDYMYYLLTEKNVVLTDQKLINNVLSNHNPRHNRLSSGLQLYNGSGNPWFYLGLVSRKIYG